MTTKTFEREDLFQAIQNLPDDKLNAVFRFMQIIQDEDDEPLTEEDLQDLDRADEEIAAGHFYTLDEFNRRMADLP